jgi:hypothetical protein
MALVKITVKCTHCKVDHEEYDQSQFDDREKYLAYWNMPFEGPEADEAWKQKLEMTPRESAMVQSDIQGYVSQVDGSWIDSRSKHRSHLKQHKMIEVGNEKQETTANKPQYNHKLKQTLIEVANEKLRYK